MKLTTYLVTITHDGRQYITLELATTERAALLRAMRSRPGLREAVKRGEARHKVMPV